MHDSDVEIRLAKIQEHRVKTRCEVVRGYHGNSPVGNVKLSQMLHARGPQPIDAARATCDEERGPGL